jgi:hypothetical protein
VMIAGHLGLRPEAPLKPAEASERITAAESPRASA